MAEISVSGIGTVEPKASLSSTYHEEMTSGLGNGAESESIRVLVRIRPLNQDEITHAGNNSSILAAENNSLTLRNPDSKKQFQCSFDAVLGPSSTQEEVYSSIRVCTNSVKDGFNRYVKEQHQLVFVMSGSSRSRSPHLPLVQSSPMVRQGVGRLTRCSVLQMPLGTLIV
jgi:hypothetical protein